MKIYQNFQTVIPLSQSARAHAPKMAHVRRHLTVSVTKSVSVITDSESFSGRHQVCGQAGEYKYTV